MSTRNVSVERLELLPDELVRSVVDDEVAIEEPLEIRVDDDTLAITMRTPGNDRELVLGFLVSEGIIARRDDVSSLANCGRPGEPGYANTIAVTLGPGAQVPASERVRRGTLTSSACGVCGRRSIDDLLARVRERRTLPTSDVLPAGVVLSALRRLRERQPLFDRTGGVHAASLLDFRGEPIANATYEDVGRHNAVDKVVGSQLLAGAFEPRDPHEPRAARLLIVSGRSSFEIVQKAISANIDAVASVSAPSSLAVDLARQSGLTLFGFVRGDRLVVYSGGDVVT